LTLHKTDAGKADYRNERNKFGSHTATLEKPQDRSQRISVMNERKVTMKDCGLKKVRIKKDERRMTQGRRKKEEATKGRRMK
jgi:hypothetical protein